MERRNFIAGIAALELAEAADTAYIPDRHKVTDARVLADFMREFAFADLITASPKIRVTHIPVMFEQEGTTGKIYGHVAKANPQQETFTGSNEAVIVFHGPHAYISPNWYRSPGPAVPTWNFAVVHASGKPRAITDDAQVTTLLDRLVAKFESYQGTGWDLAKLPESYKKGMRQGIVAFEMEIEALEGKFKLGLERSAADRAGVLEALKTAKAERSLYELTKERAG